MHRPGMLTRAYVALVPSLGGLLASSPFATPAALGPLRRGKPGCLLLSHRVFSPQEPAHALLALARPALLQDVLASQPKTNAQGACRRRLRRSPATLRETCARPFSQKGPATTATAAATGTASSTRAPGPRRMAFCGLPSMLRCEVPVRRAESRRGGPIGEPWGTDSHSRRWTTR